MCFCRCVFALLSYIQQFILTLWPWQTAKLSWKHKHNNMCSYKHMKPQQCEGIASMLSYFVWQYIRFSFCWGKLKLFCVKMWSIHRTIFINLSVLFEGSQVEAFPEALAVPYLNSSNHKSSVKMLKHQSPHAEISLTSRSWWPPVSLTTALRPWIGESPLRNLKNGTEIKLYSV